MSKKTISDSKKVNGKLLVNLNDVKACGGEKFTLGEQAVIEVLAELGGLMSSSTKRILKVIKERVKKSAVDNGISSLEKRKIIIKLDTNIGENFLAFTPKYERLFTGRESQKVQNKEMGWYEFEIVKKEATDQKLVGGKPEQSEEDLKKDPESVRKFLAFNELIKKHYIVSDQDASRPFNERVQIMDEVGENEELLKQLGLNTDELFKLLGLKAFEYSRKRSQIKGSEFKLYPTLFWNGAPDNEHYNYKKALKEIQEERSIEKKTN